MDITGICAWSKCRSTPARTANVPFALRWCVLYLMQFPTGLQSYYVLSIRISLSLSLFVCLRSIFDGCSNDKCSLRDRRGDDFIPNLFIHEIQSFDLSSSFEFLSSLFLSIYISKFRILLLDYRVQVTRQSLEENSVFDFWKA